MTMLIEKYILACIDSSQLSDSVIEHAIWLANNSQLPIMFVHTIEHSHLSQYPDHEGHFTPNMIENLLHDLTDEERTESKHLIAEGKIILNNAVQLAEQAGVTKIIVKQRHGSVSEALQDLKMDIELVVLGATGEDHQADKKGLGSQLEQAIRATDKPMMIVKKPFIKPRNLMLAYNGSPLAKKAIEIINKDAFLTSLLNIHIVSVQQNSSDAQRLVDDVEVALLPANFVVKTSALTGDPLEKLNQYQQENDIDLTMMGAFSHGKIHGFMFGSFTTKMLLDGVSNYFLLR
jgi:nucleotide-binding universal stress UspA family protein